MGVKSDQQWFTQLCLLDKTTLKELRLEIIRTLNEDKSYRPVIAVDASVWLRRALKNPRDDSNVLSQYHAKPPVPVTAVADYFMARIRLLNRYMFRVVLVFDGQRHPLKDDEYDIRKSQVDLESLKQQLQQMFDDPDSYGISSVLAIQKQLMIPRQDILHEVICAAKKHKTDVVGLVGSPYETDTQVVALQKQGIIDAAITTDSDFTALGVKYVVSEMTLEGKVNVRSYQKLTTQVLPNLFGVEEAVDGRDLRFLVQMLGNDNLPRGLAGSGVVDVIARMKVYLRLGEQQKQQYINDYINNHDTPVKCRHSINYWEHAPAYKVIPNNPDESAKSAFFSGEYTVKLCSMTLDEAYQYNPADEIIGFVPENYLRNNHETQPYTPTDDEFFRCISWSRNGLPFEPVPDQYNSSGDTVLHEANIDFDKHPMKFVMSRALVKWLECRGVPIPSLDSREQIVDMVKLCLKYKIDSLPSYVMRSGGGCVTFSIMKFADEETAVWYTGEDALRELRSDRCPPLDDPSILESFFEEQHNSKRERCLSHVKDGSYDLKDIKVTNNLKSTLMDDNNNLTEIL